MFTPINSNADIQPSTNLRTVLILPLLVCALLAGLALGPVETARAQTDDEPATIKVVVEGDPMPDPNSFAITSAPWRTHFGEYAAQVILEADPGAKEAALQDLILVAKYSNGNIDFSATLMPLVDIFEQGPSEDHSLMALQALDLIGTEQSSDSRYRQAMAEIDRIAQKKSSDRVREAAAEVMLAFTEEDENGQ